LPQIECAWVHLSSLHGDENPHVLFFGNSGSLMGLS